MHTRSSSKRTKTASLGQDLDEQKKLVLPELGEAIELPNDSFARSLYHDLASDSAIDSFLKTSRFYSLQERRWKLPRSYTKLLDTNFYTPFRNIISTVVKRFWGDATRQRSREVVDTHATGLQHSDADPATHTSRPSLVIKAKGPSFQLPCIETGQVSAKIGFTNIAACIEIQVEGGELPVFEQLARAAIYARQLFIQQPNRRFVRVLTITGHHLRLFHFDRSGAQYTPPLNFNDDPHTFVRLILGLSSPNELDIGLDPSIHWRVENGRKVSGTLTTRAAGNTEKVYPLIYIVPFFSRCHIYGRGTTCWIVSDPVSGEILLVKDSWRSDDRTSEYVHLQDALGVPGVVQMVSCEPDRGQTKDLRCLGDSHLPDFENRVDTRVVMHCYTHPIINFTSAKQLLCALRDAIAGHKKLFKKGTLHRDVSIQNIVLGVPGADPGDRGILIDLDMATRRNEAGFHPPMDWRIGTPLYQSIMILYSVDLPQPLPHDHLDDIESFFYVLTYIIYNYDCHGVSHPIDKLLKRWEASTGTNAAESKEAFLSRGKFIPRTIASRWPNAFLDVFLGFRTLLYPLVQGKVSIMGMDPEDVPGCLRWFALNAERHYDKIIETFDTGIAALEKADAEEAASRKQMATLPQPLQPPAQRSPLKRPSGEYPESQPPAKRSSP
ncbi:hypothetical protein H1R20_g16121, partial [Candolleomyces eurysporus]